MITCYCADQHSSTCPTASVTGCSAVQQTLHRCCSLAGLIHFRLSGSVPQCCPPSTPVASQVVPFLQLFPCILRVKPISTAGHDVPHAVYCSLLQFASLSRSLYFPVNVGDPVAHARTHARKAAANHGVQQLTPY